jgi:hypothetical protein
MMPPILWSELKKCITGGHDSVITPVFFCNQYDGGMDKISKSGKNCFGHIFVQVPAG